MATPPVAERVATTERAQTQQGIFTDNLVPERVFTSELRRIDSTLSGITKTLERIDGRLDRMEVKFDERLDKMNTKIDTKIDNLFYWMVGTMLVFTGLITSVIFAFLK